LNSAEREQARPKAKLGKCVIKDDVNDIMSKVLEADVVCWATPIYYYEMSGQMKAGIYDIMNHIMEQYFSDFDDNTSDYLSEGLIRSLITSSRIAVKNPQDYEARSNIMWTATWALNTLIGLGKRQDWMVHMIGHSVGAWTHAPHGYTLAAVSMAYYRRAMQPGLAKFVRFAKNVWDVCPRWQDRPADSRGRSRSPESLDAGNRFATDHQRTWCYCRHDSQHHPRHHLLSSRLYGPEARGHHRDTAREHVILLNNHKRFLRIATILRIFLYLRTRYDKEQYLPRLETAL
jgi:hypothetical protein